MSRHSTLSRRGPREFLFLGDLRFKVTDHGCRRHLEGLADSKKHLNRRRFLIVFEMGDVGSVDAGSKRKLLLRQPGPLSGIAQNVSQHAGSVLPLAPRVR